MNYSITPGEALPASPFTGPSQAHTPASTRPISNRSIGKGDLVELGSGLFFAKHIGRCLNFHTTIRWDFSEGFDPEPRAWLAHQGKLFEAMGRWKQRRGIPEAHIWMREIGPNNGHHTHLLVHLPADQVRDFIRFMMEAGRFREVVPGLLPVFVTGGRNASTTGAVSIAQQRGLLFYLAKSLSPTAKSEGRNVAQALGIRTKANVSDVCGKPCGTHRSIGRKARQDADWNDFTSLSALRAALEGIHV